MAGADHKVIESGEQLNPAFVEQGELLLRTKMFVPPVRPKRVIRPRLFEQMDSGLNKALIMVSAPAGYGKTTLVSSWLHDSGVPSTWISLDEADNDPIRFLQYLVTALQKVHPALQIDVLGFVRGMDPFSIEPLLNTCINEIATGGIPFVLVLDDFHAIHAQPVLGIVSYLLEHVPPQMHIALLTRTDPPLPIAHLRARNQLAEIRAEHLRFTRQETSYFLNEACGLDLFNEEISALEARTEGWIAGLQLAAISMQGSNDIHRFVTTFTGSHSYIMDYLTEEVLRRQPEKVSEFLLQTSVLRHMCGALCEAVVHSKATEPIRAQVMLENLERMNLFLVPLDNERRWYRYHHLFGELLNRRLELLHPGLAAELHHRASTWYEQNGLIPEAIQHAIAAGNRERVTQLIEQNGVLLLIRGEVTTLLGWIEVVEPTSQDHPWLYIMKAWAYALTGNFDHVSGMLQVAEELISPLEDAPEVRIMKGTIAAARAYMANVLGKFGTAMTHARQALEYLPDSGLIPRSLRTVAISLLGDASSMSGNLEEAWQAYLEAEPIAQAAGDINLIIVLNSNLANILEEQGALHQAARIYSKTLEMATLPGGGKPVITGRIYAELSQVYYEWNQLSEASQYVDVSLSLCRQWGNMDLQAVNHVMRAKLEFVYHRPEKALEAMQAAEELVRNFNLGPRYAKWVEYNLARMWISEGNHARAFEYLQKFGINAAENSMPVNLPGAEITYLNEPGYLVLLRLLLADGKHDEALRLSQRLLQLAEKTKRTGRMIEVLALQALAYRGKKEGERALQVLERALSHAQSEGYVRVFLDEGEPMARLLFQAKSTLPYSGYIHELLAALGGDTGTVLLPANLLVEPLTSRELEVLKLIEVGCSNQEVADLLVISLPTVKRHISNIYSKLGAKNRTQAVSLGRELRLLE